MIPPLCPACGRRASQRANYFPSMGRGGFIECRSPFHDAGDWGPALLEAGEKLYHVLLYRDDHDPSPYGEHTKEEHEAMDAWELARRAAVEGRKEEEVHDG